MARTLGDLKTILFSSLGGRNDAAADSACTYAVNVAIQALTLLLDLPEARGKDDLAFGVGTNEVVMTSTWNPNDVVKVYNSTDAIPMGFIPIELIEALSPTSGKPRVYSRSGNYLLIRPTPTVETTVSVRYTKFLARLTDDTNEIPIEHYEAQILAIATAIAWACFEEAESAEVWLQVAQILGVPYTSALDARKVIEGRYNLKEFLKEEVK